jgi:hypothetical protein
MLRFLPEPAPPDPLPSRERRLWTFLLFAAAAVTAIATRWPWLRVKFERLFAVHAQGSGLGPPGWQSTAGFTCLCTSLLVAVMALAETGSPTSRQAVRPGSLLLAGIALVALLFDGLQGPGSLRGVSAVWTGWYYVAWVSLPILVSTCLLRWAVLRRQTR